MNSFIQRHQAIVTGQLNGFDRIRLRGTKRLLSVAGGIMFFLWRIHVLMKNWKAYVMEFTQSLRSATEAIAKQAQRPLIYVAKPSASKEDMAREIARRDGITSGLICILSSLEPCQSFDLHRNREKRELELRGAWKRCLHYYHYFLDDQWGFMHVRLQTWMPLTMNVCLNGREWLARQMTRQGIDFTQCDNCFTHIADLPAAQRLMDQQLEVDWPALLGAWAGRVNPVEDQMLHGHPVEYYWSADQTEWASDVMFRSAADLTALYPHLIHYGITSLGSSDIMRFLGRRVSAQNPSFKGEVVSDLRTRPEGIRLKHRVNHNSLKTYNKAHSLLRVETTINQPGEFLVYRTAEGHPDGPKAWREMRKGVADLAARAAISQGANDRYLEAMATVEDKTLLKELGEPLCQRVRWKGRRHRAINPLAKEDASLLAAVTRGEFLLHGFRNRDLREILYGAASADPVVRRRQTGRITRLIRLLRAHSLIRKSPHTHRYQVTTKGRLAISALLLARQADTAKLAQAA